MRNHQERAPCRGPAAGTSALPPRARRAGRGRRSGGDLRLLDALLRYRYYLLALLALALLLASAAGTPDTTDWSFFVWGSDTLFGSHRDFVRGNEVIAATGMSGLHLYAEYPFLQIGPPALLIAPLLEIGPREGVFAVGAVVQGLGLLVILLLGREAADTRRSRMSVLVGGALLLLVWTGLSHTRHLDDAIALTAVAGAAVTMPRRKPVLCGLLLGLAAASKPWAVGAAPLLLALPTWRWRAAAAIAAIGCVGVFWLPFVVADAGTLQLGDVSVPFALDSAPAALGGRGLEDPQQLRLLQFLGGMGVATLVVLLGRWQLAVVAAFALRLLVEPFPYQYYMASLALAALVADLLLPNRFPLLTAGVVAGWITVSLVPASTGANIRLVTFGGLLLGALAVAVVSHLRGSDASSAAATSR